MSFYKDNQMKTIPKVLVEAIEWEYKAHLFYKEASLKEEYGAASKILEKLANEELKHKQLLERYVYEGQDFNIDVSWMSLVNVLDRRDYRHVNTILKLLDFALDKEVKAQSKYVQMAKEISDKSLQDLCMRLSVMESGHVNLIKTEKERLMSKPM